MNKKPFSLVDCATREVFPNAMQNYVVPDEVKQSIFHGADADLFTINARAVCEAHLADEKRQLDNEMLKGMNKIRSEMQAMADDLIAKGWIPYAQTPDYTFFAMNDEQGVQKFSALGVTIGTARSGILTTQIHMRTGLVPSDIANMLMPFHTPAYAPGQSGSNHEM